MKKPEVISRKIVYENPYQKVYQVGLRFEAGQKELYVTDYGHRVSVILEGPEGILLVRQYRYLIDRVGWEVPGGKLEPEEDFETGARRECREETGVQCGALEPLKMFHPGLDTLHNPSHIFVCREYDIVESGPIHRGGNLVP